MTDTRIDNSNTSGDPATIERDIRRTQDEMSRTVDKLGDQLTMKNLFNALLEKADDNGVDANYLLDGARRNPIALGLIAAGAIWLVSDKDSRFPSRSSKSRASGAEEFDSEGRDVHHRDYVSHMSALDMREGEDPTAYQRRRDMHRATFLMCERKPDEDEHGFRQRLDDLTDKFREKRRAWTDTISQAGSSTAQSAQSAAAATQHAAGQAVSRAQDLYDSNPLVGGILAAAVGAAIGSAIPISRKEQETLGHLGGEALTMVGEQADKATEQLREKKDQIVDKVEEKLQQTPAGQDALQPSARSETRPPQEGNSEGSDAPFIISERTN